MSLKHDYERLADAEIALWPGVSFVRAQRGKHLSIVLTYADRSRFVAYPATPSCRRGALNHVTHIRHALIDLNACRTSTKSRHLETAQ